MKFLFLSFAFAALCVAQNPQPMEHQVVPIKHADIHEVQHSLQIFGFPVAPAVGNSIVLNGPKDRVDAAVEAIEKMDVPPAPVPDLEIIAYLITASAEPGAESAPLPDGLAAVVAQLKGLFHYRGYRLLDSAIVRCRSGSGGDIDGTIWTDKAALATMRYSFFLRKATLSGDQDRMIHLEGLRLDLKSQYVTGASGSIQQIHDATSGINTDVDIHEGQKVVVGKASTASGSDGALILVLSAKVIE